MELQYKINSKILLLALAGIIMVCSSYLTFAYNPIEMISRRMLTMRPGSIFFNLWSKPPYDVVLKLYLFNITNHEAFLQGREKLRVEEVGPFVYHEQLVNENAIFNDDGTMTYTPKRLTSFDKELSFGDHKTMRVIVPNIPLLGIQASVSDSFIKSIGFGGASRMLNAKLFIELSVEEYLFGYDDKLVTAGNKFLPSWIDFGNFGILDRLLSRDNNNNVTLLTDPSKYKSNNSLLTDEENHAPFHIVKWNGSPGFKEWGYENSLEDNTVEREQLAEGAFEGTVFPSYMPPNTSITLFRKAFCRPVPLKYMKQTISPEGFDVYRYTLAPDIFEPPEVRPGNKVYCHKGKCPKRGLGSIAPCYYDIPIALSFPHFLRSDPSIVEKLDGIKPNASRHESTAMIHTQYGLPITGNLRVQINLDVGQTRYNERTRPLNDYVVPIFWIEMTVTELPQLVYFLVNLGCHIGPIVQLVAAYLLAFVGLACISGSACLVLFFSNKSPIGRNARLSLNGEYSALPIINLSAQYFHELKTQK